MQAIRNGEVSFWHRDMGGPPLVRSALPGDSAVDVCIVGAGYTGLWTAWYLKQHAPDLSIAIVEREWAGFGASGRNGGWLTGGFSWNRERYARTATRQSAIDLERALLDTVDEVISVAAAEGIDADIHRTDELTIACNTAQVQRLHDERAEALAWGTPRDRLEWIDESELAHRIRVRNALGALVLRHVARIQPAKLVRGLALAVERKGVTIHEQTEVTGISTGGVTTDRGTVTAPHILIATEGYTPALPGMGRRLLALNSALVVTEPLPDALWDRIGWAGRELLGDASHAYCYAQRTEDGRIAMGGRGVPYRYRNGADTNGRTQARTIELLHGILRRLLPEAAGLKLDHAWCGVMGVPRDWCARVQYDPVSRIGSAGGYVGVGVSTSNLAGRTLADLVLRRDTDLTRLPWVNRAPRDWEPEPLRWLGVHAMYRLYHWADRAEAASASSRTSRLARLANALTGR